MRAVPCSRPSRCGSSGAYVSGRRTVKVLPTPSWLSTETLPPCCSTTCCTPASPMPLPAVQPGHVRPALEPLEDARPVRRRDAQPLVGHRQHRPRAVPRHAHRDLAAVRAVLDRVAEQVVQHPRQPRGVPLPDQRGLLGTDRMRWRLLLRGARRPRARPAPPGRSAGGPGRALGPPPAARCPAARRSSPPPASRPSMIAAHPATRRRRRPAALSASRRTVGRARLAVSGVLRSCASDARNISRVRTVSCNWLCSRALSSATRTDRRGPGRARRRTGLPTPRSAQTNVIAPSVCPRARSGTHIDERASSACISRRCSASRAASCRQAGRMSGYISGRRWPAPSGGRAGLGGGRIAPSQLVHQRLLAGSTWATASTRTDPSSSSVSITHQSAISGTAERATRESVIS